MKYLFPTLILLLIAGKPITLQQKIITVTRHYGEEVSISEIQEYTTLIHAKFEYTPTNLYIEQYHSDSMELTYIFDQDTFDNLYIVQWNGRVVATIFNGGYELVKNGNWKQEINRLWSER